MFVPSETYPKLCVSQRKAANFVVQVGVIWFP